ncbi:nectin-1-like isoform X1 [Acipenser ruthenus]|uniref:nectin-1-like isoform X1 n=1 Tax=Acipenser ruthenus TaxID=7906 RepID=UPI0027418A48|nr:nectin-1-like isoform X1 [Acipenser ruthenus]
MAVLMLSSFLICLLAVTLSAAQSQVVQVDDRVSGFVGTEVVLSCTFSNTNPNVKITQVTWQKLLNGTKQNVAIANPTMGVSVLPPYKDRVTFRNPAVGYRTPSLEDATIRLSGLRLSDEAAYICEYATFPAGNRENQLNLTVLAKPITRMTLTSPTITAQAGETSKKVVATCVSSNGKPPSVITWETKLKGEPTFQETRNPNGTVTVHSNYLVVPSREIHRQQLTCIVNYQSERITNSLTLNVLYEPEVTIEGFDGNWYLNRQDVKLTCKSDANPPVTVYQWKLLNGTMPVNVEVLNSTLFFKGPVTSDLAGTYVCEAANVIGTRSGLVEVNVTDKPLPQGAPGRVIGIIGGIVAAGLIIGVAVTVFVVYRHQQKSRTETDNDLTDLPPAHKPAPPPPKKKTIEMKSHLTAGDIQVVHLDKPEEQLQKFPLQPPYYDMAPSESSPYSDTSNSGKRYEELPNPADYVSYHHACLEPQPPPAYPPISLLPQNPYTRHPPNSPVYRYPPPGSRAPYICPKEQYV